MQIDLTQKRLFMIIRTLEAAGHCLAGMSQEPDLITKEDTEEWKLAQVLKKLANRAPTVAIQKNV